MKQRHLSLTSVSGARNPLQAENMYFEDALWRAKGQVSVARPEHWVAGWSWVVGPGDQA